MFDNHFDWDFNDFWDKMELDITWGTYIELLAFSTMLEIDINVYDNIQWVKPLISIKRTQIKGNFTFIYKMVSLWCALSFREERNNYLW